MFEVLPRARGARCPTVRFRKMGGDGGRPGTSPPGVCAVAAGRLGGASGGGHGFGGGGRVGGSRARVQGARAVVRKPYRIAPSFDCGVCTGSHAIDISRGVKPIFQEVTGNPTLARRRRGFRAAAGAPGGLTGGTLGGGGVRSRDVPARGMWLRDISRERGTHHPHFLVEIPSYPLAQGACVTMTILIGVRPGR